MPKILRSAPFVTFPTGNGPTSSSELGLGPTLEFLGQSTAGDLYLNQDLASVGLVCGGLAGDVENTVKRLVASHLSDSDAQLLILYSDGSTICRKACPLMKLSGQNPKILVSPRSPESISRLYESAGATAVPLCFEESSITTQHLLSLFTPPLDMRKRSSILNTVQLVIGQLHEPFDLQHFIELVEKETWTEDGANFMALRQTFLTGLLSSQTNASFSSEREIIVDFGDPILSYTGMESVLMDMVLQQFLHATSGRKRLVVLYNAHEYLSAHSPLSRSLECLASLGSNSPTSVIIAAPSPSNIYPSIFKGLDYMVCGLARFAVWESTLQAQLSIRLPKSQWDSGYLTIWSPDSRSTRRVDYPGDQESPKWGDKLLIIDVHELVQTTPQPDTYQPNAALVSNGEAQPNFDFGTPARGSTAALSSHSLPLLDEGEEGVVPLDSMYAARGNSPDVAQWGDGADALNTVEHASSSSITALLKKLRESREAREANATATAPASSVPENTDSLPEWTRVEKKRVVPLENQYPDLFRPLVSGVLTLSSRKVDVWVDFEDLRGVVGDKKTLQTLGWGTFTSYVKTSNEQKILELRYKAGSIKSVKLLPLTAREKYVKSLTPVALALATCPARFRSLVEAILKAGGNDTQAKVPMEDLVTHFILTPEDLQAFIIRGANVPYWFQQAVEGKWIRSGKLKNGRTWFGLGSKLQSLAGPQTATAKAGPEVHAAQHFSPPGGSEAGTDSGGW